MAWLHESHIHHDLGFSSQIVGEYPSTLMALPHLGHESLTFVTLYWVGSVFKAGKIPGFVWVEGFLGLTRVFAD